MQLIHNQSDLRQFDGARKIYGWEAKRRNQSFDSEWFRLFF